MFAFKPDLDRTMQRMDAFWDGSVLDRPVVQFYLEKPLDKQIPLPESRHASTDARWLDVGYQARLTDVRLANRVFMGDSLPVAFPNLGPEILAAFYGCPLHFGDYGTSWTEPILKDWSEADQIALNWENPYFLKLAELTDAMLDLGKGKYIVGMPDWHPGGDLLAALRNPQDLAVDLIEKPEQVKVLLKRLQPDYYKVYDFWYEKLHSAGHPITSWLELTCAGKYYIPSNDFAGMISTKMYNDFFLSGIVDECNFLDRSIYHLDGSGALRHLDTILEIPRLGAVQWVPGAGREGFSKWVAVYQKIQAARKGMFVYCDVADLELLMHSLTPNGLTIWVEGVTDIETGERILAALEKWTLNFNQEVSR